MTFFLHINFTTDIILTLIILLKCLPILMLLWKVAQQNANKHFTSKNKMPTLQIYYKYNIWTQSYYSFCLRQMRLSFTSCLVYLWCVVPWTINTMFICLPFNLVMWNTNMTSPWSSNKFQLLLMHIKIIFQCTFIYSTCINDNATPYILYILRFILNNWILDLKSLNE